MYEILITLIVAIVSAIIYDKIIKPHMRLNDSYIVKKNSHKVKVLSKDRKEEIEQWRKKYEPQLIQLKKDHIAELKKNQKFSKEKNPEFCNEPAWFTISTTNSDINLRLIVGFKNKGCKYWREDPNHIGCLHCTYGSSAYHAGEINEVELLKQFGKAKKWALQHGFDYDVIEFLNDGSFFNFDDEFPTKFVLSLFKEIHDLSYVKRILIESRPEYITEDKIELILKKLNKNQMLEIGIGLETSSDFIRNICIKKGYGNNEFNEALKVISKYRDRCHPVVYMVVKPAFLTELEAIEDVLNTLVFLKQKSKEFSMPIIPKLEPIVISQSSILDLLHFGISKEIKEYYSPLSYWSVIEIILRAYKFKISNNIRIGAREDMEVIEKVPAIYRNDGTFNQYDFWIYDSIQKFNSDHDIIRLLSDVQAVKDKDIDFSLQSWQDHIGLESSMIDEFLKIKEKKIVKYRKKDIQIKREIFMCKVFEFLDALELVEESQSFASNLKTQHINNSDSIEKYSTDYSSSIKDNIENFLYDKVKIFFGSNYEIEVMMWFFEKDDRKMLRIYSQLYNISEKCIHDIWVGIPTE